MRLDAPNARPSVNGKYHPLEAQPPEFARRLRGQRIALARGMTLIEQLVASRQVRIVGGVVGFIILCISMGFLAASRAPIERISTQTEAPAAYNHMPILRALPSGQPKKARSPMLTSLATAEERTTAGR